MRAATGGNSSQISACNEEADALNELLHQFLSEQHGQLAPRAADDGQASADLSRASSRCAVGGCSRGRHGIETYAYCFEAADSEAWQTERLTESGAGGASAGADLT